jgi:hypothetical protein
MPAPARAAIAGKYRQVAFALSTNLFALSAKIACSDERIHPRNHRVQDEMCVRETQESSLSLALSTKAFAL